MPFRTQVFIYFHIVNKVRCIKCDVHLKKKKKKYSEKNGKKHGDHAQTFGAMDITNCGDGMNHNLPELHVMQGTALQI